MVGLGNYNNFEAQLPMALEAIAADGIDEHYDFKLDDNGKEPIRIDLRIMIEQIIDDVRKDVDRGVISARFHNTIAASLLETAKKAREKTALDTIALSGGVFCNRYLINRLVNLLKKNSFRVLFNRDVPSNDGGISLGQAAIAANLIRSKS